MSPTKKLYKPEYANELFKIAEGDLNSAKALRSSSIGRPENIFFMGQQAIEKSLKAILCAKGEAILHTHDIEALLVSIGEEVEIPHRDSITSLTEYAMIRRYQEGSEIYSAETLDSVVSICEEVLKAAKLFIESKK